MAKTAGDEPVTGKVPALDGDAMSAPDQAQAQQLASDRAAAVARGDKQAIADIDARQRALAGNQQ